METKTMNFFNKAITNEETVERNILQQSNFILTSITILIVALISSIFELIDRLTSVTPLIVIFGLILIFILLLSMYFAISTQKYFKQPTREKEQKLLQQLELDEDFNGANLNKPLIAAITEKQQNISHSNQLRIINLKRSLILIQTFLYLLLLFSIIIIILS